MDPGYGEAAEPSAGGAGSVPPKPHDSADAYLPGDRHQALVAGRPMADRVHGGALFADISGFTPLTEVLAAELGPHRGAEELTNHLNRVFQALIDELYRFRGHVIYFSGDAITCWLDGDDGVRSTACALAMQRRMADVGEVVTPAGVPVRLAMKVAVAVGAARRFSVGDPEIQRIDVLAGRLIDELASTEHLAARGEVLLGASAVAALGERVDCADRRYDERTGGYCAVVRRLGVEVAGGPLPLAAQPLPEPVVRQWLLPAVFARVRTGRGEFLAELRPAYPVFVRFGGIDYDNDDAAIERLDQFIRQVQRIFTEYGGNLLHLTLGDKGAYLCGVFGAPQAHEDDAARAATAALRLRELDGQGSVTGLQLGIAHGRLRSGTYGHERRRTYTCLGDAVNLAARLMAQAAPGEIYAAEPVRRAAGDGFAWEPLAPLRLKGKAEPVQAFLLGGLHRSAAHRPAGDAPRLVGRRQELDALAAWLDAAISGNGRIVGIAADAGMGKSRLVAAFADEARRRGAVVAQGECQAYGANISYFVWRDVWTLLLAIDPALPGNEQEQALVAKLAAIDPELAGRAPLLAGVLDLPLADNELTATFDAKLRKTSLEGLLAECLRACARSTPLVVVLEDCHWLDPLSRDLLVVLARALAGMRVLLILAYRPATDVGGGLGVEQLPHFDEMALKELDREQAAELIAAKLAPMFPTGAAPPATLVDRLGERAQGNPFYIEELVSYLRTQHVDLGHEAAVAALELPESLHSLILGRIDTLEERARRTLKVASVLGRSFRAPVLPGVYPELGALGEVQDDLRVLAAVDLVSIDQEAAQSWAFRHVVTQEVAYGSMPFAFRAALHESAGDYIETEGGEPLERNVALLAHHYWHSNNLPKKRLYLGRAGDAAQAAYANASAIDYFERLQPLVDGRERVTVLLKLGRVLELVGDWKRAEKVERDALVLAEEVGDRGGRAASETALAEVARKRARYDEAVALLARAQGGFEDLGDEAGVGRVLHLAGTVAAQRGAYDEAVAKYEASLAIRERIGDRASMAGLFSNLGVVAEYRGDYSAADAYHQRALALRREIGDRWAIGVSMNNLGMIAFLQQRFGEAHDWFRQSMQLSREVGDAWLVAIGHNNLGNATRGLGDYAAACGHYAESLRAYRDYGDRWALAFLLEDIGLLAALVHDAPAALELIGVADAFRASIGTARAPALAKEIDDRLTAAVAGMTDDQCNAYRDRGRALDLGTAVDVALAFCARQAPVPLAMPVV